MSRRARWAERRARWKRYWTEKGATPRWQLVGVYALIVVAGAIGFQITRNQTHRTDHLVRENRVLARSAANNADQAKALGVAIQTQRTDACNDQNARHKKTIQTLRAILADFVKKHPDQSQQVKDSVRSNVLLINALAPKRDCAALTTNP
jgi:hypothetical protein